MSSGRGGETPLGASSNIQENEEKGKAKEDEKECPSSSIAIAAGARDESSCRVASSSAEEDLSSLVNQVLDSMDSSTCTKKKRNEEEEKETSRVASRINRGGGGQVVQEEEEEEGGDATSSFPKSRDSSSLCHQCANLVEDGSERCGECGAAIQQR